MGEVVGGVIAIVLLSGPGRVFFPRHKLSPEQDLVVRWPERNKEPEIRVVGQLGSHEGRHTYGVAFFDPHLNFWEIDFPPISPAERDLGLLSIACSSCHALEKIDDSGIEADVCATNEGVLRYCKRCGSSTFWKPAQGVPQQPVPSAIPRSPSSAQLPFSSPPDAPPPPSTSASPSHYDPHPVALPVAPPVPPAPPSPYYPPSSEFALDPSSSLSPSPASSASPARPCSVGEPPSALPGGPKSEPQAAVLATFPPPPEKPAAPPANRRKHPPAKASYPPAVPHPSPPPAIL